MNTLKLMRFRSVIALSILAGFLAATSTNSFAAGGGGGGGGGGFGGLSQSAPKVDPVVKYQEGVEALSAGDYKKAERAFKKVLSVTKKDANTNYLLGVSLMRQDKLKKARRPFEKAVKYDSDFALARGHLGAVYRATNKPEKAQEQRDALLEMQSKCGDCEDTQKITKALLILDNIDKPNASINFRINESHGDAAYLNAVAYINRGDYHSALASLSESAKVFGPHPDVLTYQGFANRKLGNKDLALQYYMAALNIQPEHRGANEYLGEYFVEIGRLDKAKQQLVKLEQICDFGCEEAEELRTWIADAS